MTETVQQPADMIARLGRNWGWVLAYGIITLAAGVAVLVWPSETLLVIAVLFGIQLIVGVMLTALDAFLILWLQNKGVRWLEALIFGFIAVLVAAHKGLNARGGPKAVADGVNQAVVLSVILLAVVNVGITQAYVMLVPQGMV